MSEARWLSSEDALPEPGELAFVYVLDYADQQLVFRTIGALADSVLSDLEEMDLAPTATISVQQMTAEQLGNLPEFDGW